MQRQGPPPLKIEYVEGADENDLTPLIEKKGLREGERGGVALP